MKEERVDLHYKEGGSDKVYNVELVVHVHGWSVNFEYGRRGSSLIKGTKTEKATYATAKKVFDKLVREKTSKGYIGTGVSSSRIGSTILSMGGITVEDTGLRPQLLNEIPERDLEKYITDDNWCAQEKWDGRRRLLIKNGTNINGTNRKGFIVDISADIVADMQHLPDNDIIFDGEAFDNHIRIFDILGTGDIYKERCKRINDIFKEFSSDILIPVETAWTTEEKRKLLIDLRKANAEGIVFKRIDSIYTAGRPASGGAQLKFKFVETASCFITGINNFRRSVSLGVYDPKKPNSESLINVGNVTVYPNQEIPKLGSVVEVKYLYYFEEGSLFQPVLLGLRDDIHHTECVISQLKVKRKELINE